MKTLRYLLVLTTVFIGFESFAQNDSVYFDFKANLQGRYQTGNLNQKGIGFDVGTSIVKSSWKTSFNVNYLFTNIENYTVMNDLWSTVVAQHGFEKRVYPVGMGYYGYAKSFGIVNAVLAGAGAGVNVVKFSPQQHLNLNAVIGYANFDYQNVTDLDGFASNIFIRAQTPIINKKTMLNWELHAFYLPNATKKATGGKSTLRLSIPLVKKIHISASYNYIYNSHVDFGISQVNTIAMLGFTYKK